MNRKDLEEKVEELEQKIEELEQSNSPNSTDDVEEDKMLYLYIRYKDEEVESPLGDFVKYRYLILNSDEEGYHIPQENVFRYMSVTRQAQELVKKYIDSWEKIEVVADSDDAIYYCASIPSDQADSIREGSWVPIERLNTLLTDYGEKEYLMEI
jgi:hypothetical protein